MDIFHNRGEQAVVVFGRDHREKAAALTDPRVVAAMIGGGVVAGGWVVTHLLSARRDRAARMYRHYIEMKIEAIGLGEKAMDFLLAHLTGGSEAVADLIDSQQKARLAEAKAGVTSWIETEKARLSAGNNPASGRFGR